MSGLRPYQVEAVESVFGAWRQGQKTALLVMPTGTGKTVVFAQIAARCVNDGERVLILAHREELLKQARDKIRMLTGLECSLEKAEESCIGRPEKIVAGSVQTLCRESRLARFTPDFFDVVIVDEAHHILSDSYKCIIEYFSAARVLGVTATPDRGDKKNLGQFFPDGVTFEYSLSTAIREGYLCNIKAQVIPLNLSIENVGIAAGDYKVNEVGDALGPYLGPIAEEMRRYATGRRTVVFLPLVATSQRFCELLRGQGFNAAEVNGNSDNRREVLEDFAAGRYDILCNSMLLTEGWDCPAVDCIVVLRPTKVRSLYCQMVGRGTRPSPGKSELLLLDFLWHTGRHDLCRPAHIIAPKAEIADAMTNIIKASPRPIDIEDAEKQAKQSAIEAREKALADALRAQRKKTARLVDPLQYAFSIAAEDLVDYEPTFPWEMEPPTQNQLETLERNGINAEMAECKGKAAKILDRVIARNKEGLSSPRQIRLLERYGFQRVGTWTKTAASKMIGRIHLNGWQVPPGVDPFAYMPEGVAV